MIYFNFALGGKKAELPWYWKAITLLIIRIENSNRLYWSVNRLTDYTDPFIPASIFWFLASQT